MRTISSSILLGALMLVARPAVAVAGGPAPSPVAIPEPADYLLFAAGLIGLIVGRKAALSRRKDDDEDA